MSLREQLVRAGLASRKDLRKINQKLKKDRKKQQATRVSRKVLEERERKARLLEQQERQRQRLEARRLFQAREEARTRDPRCNQILRYHAVSHGHGPQRFWHRTLDGRFLHRLDLPESLAMDLRDGRAAVAVIKELGNEEYVVVSADVASRVISIIPERVVFFNEAPPDPGDPSEHLL